MTEPRKTTKARAAGADSDPMLSDSGVPPAAPPPAAAATAAACRAAPPPPPPPAAPEAAAPAAPTPGAPAPAAAAAPAGPPAGAQVLAAISGVATTHQGDGSAVRSCCSEPERCSSSGCRSCCSSSCWARTARPRVRSSCRGCCWCSSGSSARRPRGSGPGTRWSWCCWGRSSRWAPSYSLLYTLRHDASYLGGLDWLSLICWWVGGALAGAGSGVPTRSRSDAAAHSSHPIARADPVIRPFCWAGARRGVSGCYPDPGQSDESEARNRRSPPQRQGSLGRRLPWPSHGPACPQLHARRASNVTGGPPRPDPCPGSFLSCRTLRGCAPIR